MNNTSVSQRDGSIDILRAMAIIGIVIAHCHPDVFFTQLRSFDVILMVFLSAVCVKGIDKPTFSYKEFAKKRFIRLIVPVWIFLIFYYAGVHIFYYLPAIPEILSSFAFISDRYVWIIRILVVLALLTPQLWRSTRKLSQSALLIILCVCLGISEVLFNVYSSPTYDIVFMTIPYGVAYVYGLNVDKYSCKRQLITSVVLLLACIGYATYASVEAGSFVGSFAYKYPPRFYYFSNGMGVTLLMWILRHQIEIIFDYTRLSSFLKYVGQHTYWLYLWHIPMVDIVGTDYTLIIRFIIIFSVSLTMVSLQYLIVKRYVSNKTLMTIFNG